MIIHDIECGGLNTSMRCQVKKCSMRNRVEKKILLCKELYNSSGR